MSRAAIIEAARRNYSIRAIAAELHPRQLAVLRSKHRFKSLLCGRRSGKTELCARMIAISILSCGAGEWTLFGARTLSIAKDLIWLRLTLLNERHGLGWKMSEHLGYIRAPNGAEFRLLGFDDKVAIEKVRGYKVRLAIFDEASTYEDLLEPLILKSLGPALSDLAGTLVISGTPGPVCAGYWFDVSGAEVGRGFERWHWTVRENPMFPRDPEEALAEERAQNGWTEDDPTYRREWGGEWVDDESALVYAFAAFRNLIQELPEPFDASTWLTTMGIDFGMTDEAAWVVLGSPKHSRKCFAIHAEKHGGMLPDEAAKLTAELAATFRTSRIVGDGGGLGKPYVEEFNRRWAQEAGVTIHHATKTDKCGAISLLNADYRKGELLILEGAADALRYEVQRLPWADAKRDKEHPAYPNHVADAHLYAWRDHASYWHRPAQNDKVETPEAARLRKLADVRARARKAEQKRNQPWFQRAR